MKRVSLRGMLLRHTPLIVGEAVFVMSFLEDVSRGDLENSFQAMGLFQVSLLPLVVEAIGRVRIPLYLQLLYAILVFTGGFMGSYHRFYDVWQPWDSVVHFFSGIMIALWMGYILRSVMRKHDFVLPRWLFALVITSFSALVAVLWEIAEFAADQALGSLAQIDNYDTMIDMITGTLSALIVAVILAWRAPRGLPAEKEVTHNSIR